MNYTRCKQFDALLERQLGLIGQASSENDIDDIAYFQGMLILRAAEVHDALGGNRDDFIKAVNIIFDEINKINGIDETSEV